MKNKSQLTILSEIHYKIVESQVSIVFMMNQQKLMRI